MPIINNLTQRQLMFLLLLLGIGLGASGFIIEYGFGAEPCRMCWWQRYAHYSIAGLSLLGLLSQRYKLFTSGTLLAALTGLGIAIWQTGGQHKLWELPAVCGGDTASSTTLTDFAHAFANMPPRCDEVTFTIFNFSLAEWNIPAMLVAIMLSIFILTKKAS